MGNNTAIQSVSNESEGQNGPRCSIFCMNFFPKKVIALKKKYINF